MQISRLREDIDNLMKENLPELFQELQQMFNNDHLGLLEGQGIPGGKQEVIEEGHESR